MKELVIGGIVVGMGINVYFDFGDEVVKEISSMFGKIFILVFNKFYVLISYD